MSKSSIEEFEHLRDTGGVHAGICQIAIELIRAGLSGQELREAMNRTQWAFERAEANDPIIGRPDQEHFRLPSHEWWPLRWRVLRRDKFTCSYCGFSDPPRGKDDLGRKATLCADHVIPLSRGGTNEESNLVCACLPCNSSKSDRLLWEWRGRYQ